MIDLQLDTNKQNKTKPVIFLRVNDGNNDGLSVTATTGNKPFDLTGWSVAFEGVTSAGKTVVDTDIQTTNEVEGQFVYRFPEQVTASAGRFKRAYFSFTKGNERTTTRDLTICVYGSVDLGTMKPDDFINPYNYLVNQLRTNFDEESLRLNEKADELAKKIDDYVSGRTIDFADFKGQFALLVENVKSDVASLKGPKGDRGDKGDQGVAGPAGAPGTSVKVLGSFDSTDSLPMNAKAGDGYFVGTDLNVFDGSKWVDVGPIRGPKGEPGEKGIAGSDGIPGEKGDPGKGIELKGLVSDVSQLPAVANDGDAFLIGSVLYVWYQLNWHPSSDLRGVKGDKGDPGVDGVTPDMSDFMPRNAADGSVTVDVAFKKKVSFLENPTIADNKTPVYLSVDSEDDAKAEATKLSAAGLVGLVGWTEE
ncbi:hypothetical protein FD13_GL001456 [Levilactobacillus senmaizukei DSM 21775 = NBRC 103853]|uniref:BppU N-terminal domain-containing protein n=1 Tax=Levilactobacillus senmaizukei DSM 21775 = NBRC 103853 TaxID=1423803 RepID=A0A0R2DAM4_9LACO|nr:BppU family phage baseplate upper protein [Levilactobacillus senmaizukei]KRN01055.1 hypothetical protein FD13_GL001456 [Levilactobacillus senmaizukei DSM 21775 = NBRC 103853]